MPFAVAAAAIGAAGAIGGAILSGNAQKSAAKQSANVQRQMFDISQADLAPFRDAGGNALSTLTADLAPGGSLTRPFSLTDFQTSPGYQFQKQQGIDAIQNSAAAGGNLRGGNTLKDLMSFGTGLANQDYWNAYNAYTSNQDRAFSKLYDVSSLGENAAANTGQQAIQTGQGVANSIIQGGNASSAQIAGVATGFSNALNSNQFQQFLGGSGFSAQQANDVINNNPLLF